MTQRSSGKCAQANLCQLRECEREREVGERGKGGEGDGRKRREIGLQRKPQDLNILFSKT